MKTEKESSLRNVVILDKRQKTVCNAQNCVYNKQGDLFKRVELMKLYRHCLIGILEDVRKIMFNVMEMTVRAATRNSATRKREKWI
jgi:hypothetical protein